MGRKHKKHIVNFKISDNFYIHNVFLLFSYALLSFNRA